MFGRPLRGWAVGEGRLGDEGQPWRSAPHRSLVVCRVAGAARGSLLDRGHPGSRVRSALLPRLLRCLRRRKPAATERFAETIVTVRGLPDPVLRPSSAQSRVACRARSYATVCVAGPARFPKASALTLSAAAAASRQRDRSGERRVSSHPERRAGVACRRFGSSNAKARLPVPDNGIESAAAEIQTFIKRYSIDSAGEGPRQLACAFNRVERALAQAAAAPDVGRETAARERRHASRRSAGRSPGDSTARERYAALPVRSRGITGCLWRVRDGRGKLPPRRR